MARADLLLTYLFIGASLSLSITSSARNKVAVIFRLTRFLLGYVQSLSAFAIFPPDLPPFTPENEYTHPQGSTLIREFPNFAAVRYRISALLVGLLEDMHASLTNAERPRSSAGKMRPNMHFVWRQSTASWQRSR